MSLILDGTNGLSDVDGTAGTPAIRGSDANTGVFFGTDIVGVSTGGSERMRVDASGNVGIGTSSPSAPLAVGRVNTAEEGGQIDLCRASDNASAWGIDVFGSTSTPSLRFIDNVASATRMSIDSSGNLLVGASSFSGALGRISLSYGSGAYGLKIATTVSGSSNAVQFVSSAGSEVGTIGVNNTNTSYVTSSDYRLKHDIQPMTGALARVAALKPCTYKWNADDSAGEGFIAHELQEVCPSAVTGDKDAVNEDGSIKPQGIDTSFLVATLTAAIQELKAINDAQAQTIESLTARVVALEGQA